MRLVMVSETPHSAEVNPQRGLVPELVGVAELPQLARYFEPEIALERVRKAERLAQHIRVIPERADRVRKRIVVSRERADRGRKAAATADGHIAHVALPQHTVDSARKVQRARQRL